MDVTPRNRENLHVQPRPWPGVCQPEEQLQAPEASAAPGEAAGGPLLCGYLGDLRLRFVFTAPGADSAGVASAGDLRRLGLTPERALMQSLVNLLRHFGAPRIVPLEEGVYGLRVDVQDFSPSYLFDRAFWNGQFAKFPQGLLAAVPRRGVLMFVPAGNTTQEAALVRQAVRALERAGSHALSACIFRFDGTGWRVHRQLPAPAAPLESAAVPEPHRGPPSVGSPSRYAPPRSILYQHEDDEEVHLEKVAAGQKMLVYSVLASFGVNGVARSGSTAPAIVFALYLALSVFSLVGVVRLTTGLRKSTGTTIVCMVMGFIPLLGIICWIVLSVQATRVLRAAGWRVGLFGARRNDD